jgi:hypothetical protein
MARSLALHDRRLAGDISGFSGAVIDLNAATSLPVTFGAVRAYAGRRRLESIFIACHGFAGANIRDMVSADAGGMGLQLGKEGVKHDNVAMWAALKNVTRNVVVYACAAANTEPGNEFTTADGRYLMGALAIYLNCYVFAADRIQFYNRYEGVIDFGLWEGRLFRFGPDGRSTVVKAPRIEMADLMGRDAEP